MRRRLGWPVPTRRLTAAEVPLGGGDPDAVPVRLALLCDGDDQAKVHAAWALAVVGPPAREATEADLRALAARQPRDAVQMTATDALRYIGARAK
jgi:HEAT repeat protein